MRDEMIIRSCFLRQAEKNRLSGRNHSNFDFLRRCFTPILQDLPWQALAGKLTQRLTLPDYPLISLKIREVKNWTGNLGKIMFLDFRFTKEENFHRSLRIISIEVPG
jgi:hypothetical protein